MTRNGVAAIEKYPPVKVESTAERVRNTGRKGEDLALVKRRRKPTSAGQRRES